MKKIIIAIIAFLFITPSVMAQNTPQGMKYQAVARDFSGEILANQDVILKIKLQSNTNSNKVHYTEVHRVVTNKFGLFSLVIGEGKIETGVFTEIPWSTHDIWMTIDIKGKGKADFTTISSSKLLAVPYAFHAATASKIVNENNTSLAGTSKKAGVPSQNWSLFGNSKTDSEKDKLGTTDEADLVIVTNNIERLRITADGEIRTGKGKFTIGGNLEVQGDETKINKDLFVGRNVHLNDSDEFDPRGETINHGKFTTKDSLTVDGYSLFKSDVTLDKNLHVLDSTISRSLIVKDDLADGGFLATFENTNNGNGDGIKIKLGKKATKNGGGFDAIDAGLKLYVLDGFGPGEASAIRGLFENPGPPDADFIASLLVPDPDDALAIAASVCLLSEQVTDLIFTEINGVLDELVVPPINLGPLCVTVDINPLDPPILVNACIPGFSAQVEIFGGIDLVPDSLNLPTGDDIDFGCQIFGDGIDFPTLTFADQSNILNGENSFVEFSDNTDWSMGAIKAQSIDEWASQYLDPIFLYELYSTFKGLDKSTLLPEVRKISKEAADSYLQIGVEYGSGNGDYAEWLERTDENEIITSGDIVGVIGGMITKNLDNAEQVMAVSHRPIVLGNLPKPGMTHLGNNIAFMGQIPVKVMGPVKSGDYIVGKSDILGYGVAVRPEEMTLDDFKLSIGRSWVTNSVSGPKMVNTVVGVHNGDYLKILKRYEMKFQVSENRLESLEAKVEILIEKDNKDNISN